MAEAKTKTKAKSKKAEKKPRAVDNPVYQMVRKDIDKYIKPIGEINHQYREFTMASFEDEDRVFRVRFLAPEDEGAVNEAYSRKYNQLLLEDEMLPSDQILEIMTKRGLWSEQKEKRLESLADRIGRMRNLIYLGGQSMTADEMDKITDEYVEIEKEHAELIATRNGFTSTSIEARAYEHRIREQIWRCTFIVKDGEEERVWNSFEEFGAEKDRVLLARVMNECVLFWQGVPTELLEEKPEAQDGESDTQ